MEQDMKLNLDKEMAMLNEALQENDELFKEIKGHYDKVKTGGSGTLNFVEKQTANLVSLRSNKVSIIQQMVNAKKTDIETQIKILNANKGEENSNKAVKEMANAMYDIIISGKKDSNISEMMSGSQKKENEDEQFSEEETDALLEARLNEEEIAEEEPIISEERNKYSYVVDTEKNIYCVDEDYNIIEDFIVPSDLNITLVIEDNEYVAKDDEGNVYEVVSFEEE